MASRSKDDLHPKLVQIFEIVLVKWLQMYPSLPVPFLSCTFRSKAEQNLLYAQGRTRKGKIVTKAKAGESPHNYLPALAFDIAFKKADGELDWNENLFLKFANIVASETKVVNWGGHFKGFKDFPHFELTNWEARI